MERSFIQACLTHCLYPDRPLPETPPDLDWNRVRVLLIRHRLAELFCVLGRAHPGLWPPELGERLREDRYRALLLGDRYWEQMSTVLSALRRADIPVMVLKGWALIPTLYEGDYGQRTYQDIDLLVLPQDAARAEGILQDWGYRGAWIELWPGYRRRYRHSRAYLLAHNPAPFGQVVAVGLHWGLLATPFYDRRMAVQQFFERAQPLRVAGVDVRGLAAEDDLVYACGHLALHHEYDEALLHYYEMASLILQAGPAFDWNAVVARTVAWRLVLPVQGILAYLETLWPGMVPAQIIEEVSQLRPTLSERCVHHLLMKKRENRSVRTVLTWLTMSGLVRRFRYLLETAFPSPQYLRQHYGPVPGGLLPLSYLRHAAAAVKYFAKWLGM